MTLAYSIANKSFEGAMRLFSDEWKVLGKEAVPPRGPLLVVSNHLSNVDPPLLGASLPRRLYFLAKRGMFKGPVAPFLRAYGAFPLDRDGHDVAALRWSLRLLQEEQVLVLFPEGTRSPKGLGPALPGIAMLAVRSQAPILPVAITGTQHLGGLWRLFCPTGQIRVTIGDPFSLPPIEGKLERAQLDSLTEMIMLRLANLLPTEYRGVYRLPMRSGSASR